MENITIPVPADIMRAIRLFAATTDIRHYLNGVCVDVGPCGARLIATDGHMLAIAHVPFDGADIIVPFQAIIPNESLANVKAKNVNPVTLAMECEKDSTTQRQFTVRGDKVQVSGVTIDGSFPNWQRVIPKECSGELAQFNPRYLGIIGKAADILVGTVKSSSGNRFPSCPMIHHNGENAAIVNIRHDFLAVVMPIRSDRKTILDIPSWVHA